MAKITTNNKPIIIQGEVNCTVLTAAKKYIYYVNYRDDKESIFKTSLEETKKIIELGR